MKMRDPITSTNVRIICDVRKFLDETSEKSEARAKYVTSSKYFTRDRSLPFKRLALLIMNGMKRSIQVELHSFHDNFTTERACSKQAFCERRGKLKPKFFDDLNQVLTSSFYRNYGKCAKRWNGLYLYAIDGSSIHLPDTEEQRRHYGCSGNKKGEIYPVARICVLYDVPDNMAIKGFLHPWTVSEKEAVPQCLSEVSLEDGLLLFDRGYPSHWLMYLLMKKKAKFVMRVSSKAHGVATKFLESPDDDTIADRSPSSRSEKRLRDAGYRIDTNKPLKVRLVKVILKTGETEVSVTNLYDWQTYAKEDLKKVYGLRWGIETYCGDVKEKLQLGQFSGVRRICVEQDFAANLFLFNLRSLIEKSTEPYVKAVGERRKYEYEVNKNVSLGLLKDRIVHPFLGDDDGTSMLMKLKLLFEKYLEPIRPGRKYLRVKKPKPKVKHHTLNNYKRAL